MEIQWHLERPGFPPQPALDLIGGGNDGKGGVEK
jgi:hypothetical protein